MWILIIGILIDQISKYVVCNIETPVVIINNFLSIEYVKNYGAIFGIMQGGNYILAIVVTIICSVIIWYIYQQKKQKENISIVWYLILAGGIGNLLDRLLRGYVVDFIATPFIATFNIADSLVVIGVILILIKELLDRIKNHKEDKNES